MNNRVTSIKIESAGNGGFVVYEAPRSDYSAPDMIAAFTNAEDLMIYLCNYLKADAFTVRDSI